MKTIYGYTFAFTNPNDSKDKFIMLSIYEMDKRIVMIEENDWCVQPDTITINDVVYAVTWKKTRVIKKAFKQIRKYLGHTLKEFSIPYDLTIHGDTSFLGVMDTVNTIGYGETITYVEFATAMGTKFNPNLIKAINSNPLPILIPTHRITKTDGTISGKYADLFHELIELEKSI